MCTVSKIWDLLGGCGSGRKISVNNSKHLQITCMGFSLIIHRQKCSHKEHPPPLKIWFLYLISNTQTVPLKKKVKSCCCRVKSTRRGFKVRRLHNDFLARFWGRGKNRTSETLDCLMIFNWQTSDIQPIN